MCTYLDKETEFVYYVYTNDPGSDANTINFGTRATTVIVADVGVADTMLNVSNHSDPEAETYASPVEHEVASIETIT